jgi:hypothetical protein
MTDKSLDALLDALPADSAQVLNALPQAEREQLLALVATAVKQKDERVDGAINNALSVVPLPLRGTVKKMLFS